jgi:hypothetical protein
MRLSQEIGQIRQAALQAIAGRSPQQIDGKTAQALAAADNAVREKQAALYGLQAQRQQQQQAIAQHARVQQQRAVAHWGSQQDEAFEREAERIAPEWKSEDGRMLLRWAARDVLRKTAGLSDAQIDAAYQAGGVLRSAAAQAMILRAAKYELARAGLRNAQRAPAPKVQRPGMSRPATDYAAGTVRELTNQLRTAKGSQGVKLAAQLLKAKRAAGQIRSY